MVFRESIYHGWVDTADCLVPSWQDLMPIASHILDDQKAEKTGATTLAQHERFAYWLAPSPNKHIQDIKEQEKLFPATGKENRDAVSKAMLANKEAPEFDPGVYPQFCSE